MKLYKKGKGVSIMSLFNKKLLCAIALVLAIAMVVFCAEFAVITDHDCHGTVCSVCTLITQILDLFALLQLVCVTLCGAVIVRLILSLSLFSIQRPVAAFYTPVQLKIKLSD